MFPKPPFDPDCPKCGGTGYQDFFEVNQSTAQDCDCVELFPKMPAWFDESECVKIPARFFGRPLKPANVNKFVVHCGETNSANFGTYFQWPVEPDASAIDRFRQVSAHGAILDDGTWQQFVRYDHAAFHAAKFNYESIGYELQGPPSRNDWPPIVIQKLRDVIQRFIDIYPGIAMICSHRYLAPNRRTDPGPNFPWSNIEAAFPDLMVRF